MPALVGLRHTVAAAIFAVCVARADAAQARRERWEKRAAAIREWGEDA